jgi:nitrile hydratase
MMKPPHDMGGDPAPQIVPDKPDEPKFEEAWHRRTLGITIATGAMGAWNIDSSRFARESLPRDDYQSFSYYEKWLGGLTNLLFQRGLISENEIMSGHSDGQADKAWQDKILRADRVKAALAAGAPTNRAADEPLFVIGQTVRVKHPADTTQQQPGHTRLPHYIADKTGVIIMHHGGHVLPNANAHFLGEQPENLYAVEFSAVDLWGQGAALTDRVVVDCWESYLVAI